MTADEKGNGNFAWYFIKQNYSNSSHIFLSIISLFSFVLQACAAKHKATGKDCNVQESSNSEFCEGAP